MNKNIQGYSWQAHYCLMKKFAWWRWEKSWCKNEDEDEKVGENEFNFWIIYIRI